VLALGDGGSPLPTAVAGPYRSWRYAPPRLTPLIGGPRSWESVDLTGSTDGTGEGLDRIARDSNGRVRVLSFARNRGKGTALLAAFRYALAEIPFAVLVTCDGDQQHRAADIPRLIRAWRDQQAAVVIGEREAFNKMPLRNRLGNTMTSTLLRHLYPGSPHDTQSGLRALDRKFVEEIVHLVRGQRYETELDILLLALEEHRHISTVPIPTIYLLGNRSSHYRPLRDSLRIYRTLIARQLARRHGQDGHESVFDLASASQDMSRNVGASPSAPQPRYEETQLHH
jgi:glycosyltransferase involved in cell wall biosynthesis